MVVLLHLACHKICLDSSQKYQDDDDHNILHQDLTLVQS